METEIDIELENKKKFVDINSKGFIIYFVRESRNIHNDRTLNNNLKPNYQLDIIKRFLKSVFSGLKSGNKLHTLIGQSSSFTELIVNLENTDPSFFGLLLENFITMLSHSNYKEFFSFQIDDIKNSEVFKLYKEIY